MSIDRSDHYSFSSTIMMNWSLIIFGLVALSSVTYAANSYLVIVPNLLKVGHDNQISIFVAGASQPVEVKFNLTIGQQYLQNNTICKAGETRNATLTLPKEFPVGAGELIITGTGGLQFEEKRDIIIYDNRHVILVQTSASTYRPRDTIEIRVIATNENLLPIENGEMIVEIYDAALKLVGEFPSVPIRSGLTEILQYPLAEHANVGTWLVSATIGNTTSSVEVLVSRPITPSFDLKAIFQRFLLRTDKNLRGVIEIDCDNNQPIFGRATIAIGQVTEQEVESQMQNSPKVEQMKNDEWRQWKSQQFEIAGRVELNYDLLSLFNVDVSKALAVQVYIQVIELASGQERVIRHVIPVFTRDVIYDIRPLEFQAGVQNEFEVIAKRPDGKPVKMEDMIVTVQMIMGNEQGKQTGEKSVEIKDFYTRGRNDIGFFNFEVPENCIGVLMTITPLDETGKVRGYRTHALPLMPTPSRHGAKLSIELLPSTVAPANTNVNVPVVSSQISTVGRTSNFYIQLIPPKSVQKFEPLPMSYVLMTNGRIILTGEFQIQPTKECQTKTVRTIRPEGQIPPTCVFNGTLPIEMTRDMIPYSTLLVYTFQPSFGFNVAESYRFSVAGLFQKSLTLNATIVPFTPTETIIDNLNFMKKMNITPIHISNKVQDKTRVELSFTGVPDSTVGLNVFEYDGILQGLSNEITKERLLKYLTTYEQVPIVNMPTMPSGSEPVMVRHYAQQPDGKREATNDLYEEKELHSRQHPPLAIKREATIDLYEEKELNSRQHPPFADKREATNDLYEEKELNSRQHPPFADKREATNDLYEEKELNSRQHDPLAVERELTNDVYEDKEVNSRQHPPLADKREATNDLYEEKELNSRQHPPFAVKREATNDLYEEKELNSRQHPPLTVERELTNDVYEEKEVNPRGHPRKSSGKRTMSQQDEEKEVNPRGHPRKSSSKRTMSQQDEEKEVNPRGHPRKSAGKRTMSQQDEEEQMNRERKGYTAVYPVEKMVFGVSSTQNLLPVEGDDIYTTSNMGRLYGDLDNQPSSSSSYYRRKLEKSINQYDVTVGNNDHVIATSIPLVFTTNSPSKSMPFQPSQEQTADVEINGEKAPMYEQSSQYGTSSWYEKINQKLNGFSQEAFTFLQSGLTIVSDFDSLRVPVEMKHENLTKLFSKFRQQTFLNQPSFGIRDEARQLLDEYISQADLFMIPPPIMLEEQARIGYYQSIFFNTSRTTSQGTGKVVLPQTKPYSTWMATGFALNTKSGLSIAQPIRLPTNQGLFLLANCPKQVQNGEHVLLTYGINNYLEKDLTNILLRIRASNDFDLIEQSKPEQVLSSSGKDYTLRIPSLKSLAVETRNIVFIPKRTGVIQIVVEVESEFGGDYEILTVFVRESGIKRTQLTAQLFDLTSEKKSYGPFIEKINQSSTLRSVRLSVSGTALDRLVKKYTMQTNSLIGIDHALVRLYRALGLRRYLNETSQTSSPLFNITADNITTAYQHLQLYGDSDGSYSFVSDDGTPYSSLYLTSLAFGAMISPIMPFRDNVTLNRTLSWILSRQQEDGSFNDNGPCFHYRYCAGEFRRESLTAIVLYSLTRDNSSDYLPEFIYHQLYNGETSPLWRAQRYLQSRVPNVKSHLLTISLFEMAFLQNRTISSELREKIHQLLLTRQLTVIPENGTKYLKYMDENMTFDDQLTLNAITMSLYANFGDYQTTSAIARWVVTQLQIHPYYDTILDAVFRTDAWLKLDCLFRKQFGSKNFAITVDVSADNGEKRQFQINSKNMDISQTFQFTLPVQQITYSVNGFGLATIFLVQTFVEPQPQEQPSTPFQLTQEFQPMPWFSEINATTCMTYTPTAKDQKLVPENFNRTIVVEVELPSGTRINVRQIGFFLSRVSEVIYFTYEPCGNKLIFFINVPSTTFGKQVCLQWCLERLSTVITWSPIQIRAYDYLQQETQLVKLVPIQFQPTVLGYSFVEAVHKVRPSLEELENFEQFKQV